MRELGLRHSTLYAEDHSEYVSPQAVFRSFKEEICWEKQHASLVSYGPNIACQCKHGLVQFLRENIYRLLKEHQNQRRPLAQRRPLKGTVVTSDGTVAAFNGMAQWWQWMAQWLRLMAWHSAIHCHHCAIHCHHCAMPLNAATVPSICTTVPCH